MRPYQRPSERVSIDVVNTKAGRRLSRLGPWLGVYTVCCFTTVWLEPAPSRRTEAGKTVAIGDARERERGRPMDGNETCL